MFWNSKFGFLKLLCHVTVMSDANIKLQSGYSSGSRAYNVQSGVMCPAEVGLGVPSSFHFRVRDGVEGHF